MVRVHIHKVVFNKITTFAASGPWQVNLVMVTSLFYNILHHYIAFIQDLNTSSTTSEMVFWVSHEFLTAEGTNVQIICGVQYKISVWI